MGRSQGVKNSIGNKTSSKTRIKRSQVLTVKSSKHEENEDTVFSQDNVFAVFDGMGGPGDGDRASKRAAETLQEALKNKPDELEELKAWLDKTVVEMEKAVFNRNNPKAGTTATIAVKTNDNQLLIASIGDSRAYLLRDKELTQLTTDDTFSGLNKDLSNLLDTISSIEEIGELNRDQEIQFVNAFQKRNQIFDALGTEPGRSYINISQFDLKPGDKIVLTSDGVHDNLTRLEIEAAANQSAEEVLKQVQIRMKEKNIRSKDDDASVIIFD